MSSMFSASTRIGARPVLLAALCVFTVRVACAQGTAAEQFLRLSLGDAARMAAKQSAPVEGANLRAAAARARVRQQEAALLPAVIGNASQSARTFNTSSFGIDFPSPPGQPPLFNPGGEVLGPVHTIDVRGRVSQMLLDYGAIERVRSARLSATALGADVATFGEEAGTRAATAYIHVLRSEAQLQARTADSTLANDLRGIARQQVAAGVGVALDVTRAESQLAAVRAQLIAARNERDRARLELLRALNLALDARLELTDSLSQVVTVDTAIVEQHAVDQAMRTRPDIRALDEQLQAAQQAAAAVRAERLPTVGVFGDDGVTGKKFGRLLPTYTVGVQLSLPLFDGYRRAGRFQERELQAQELSVRRQDLRQQVAVDVRGALLDVSSARQQVDASRERLRLAEQEVSQARERFRAGVAGNADVITAFQSLNGARTQLIDALTSYQSARVALARSEGSVTQLQ